MPSTEARQRVLLSKVYKHEVYYCQSVHILLSKVNKYYSKMVEKDMGFTCIYQARPKMSPPSLYAHILIYISLHTHVTHTHHTRHAYTSRTSRIHVTHVTHTHHTRHAYTSHTSRIHITRHAYTSHTSRIHQNL